MSRIHEALKKAAEQRAPLAAQTPEAVMPEVTPEENKRSPAATIAAAVETAPALPVPEVKKGGGSQVPPSFADISSKCAHPVWVMDPRFKVFSETEGDQSSAERFSTLRARLTQIRSTRPLKRILITSSLPAEGKSFIASNLAQSFVRQADRRVLLIDADLRAPRLHTALGTSPRPGLAEYLKGEADEYQIIQQGEDVNLCFIPYGSDTADPSELLSRERMRKLLDFVAPAFDWILLDSPPVLPVHDASILADLCDGVLFVVKAGSTESVVAEKAVAEFRTKNLLGVVLNGADRNDSYGGYYYDAEYKGTVL